MREREPGKEEETKPTSTVLGAGVGGEGAARPGEGSPGGEGAAPAVSVRGLAGGCTRNSRT